MTADLVPCSLFTSSANIFPISGWVLFGQISFYLQAKFFNLSQLHRSIWLYKCHCMPCIPICVCYSKNLYIMVHVYKRPTALIQVNSGFNHTRLIRSRRLDLTWWCCVLYIFYAWWLCVHMCIYMWANRMGQLVGHCSDVTQCVGAKGLDEHKAP